METGIESDALPDKALQGATGLPALLKDRDMESIACEQAPAQQSAQSGAQDEGLRHSGR